MCSEHPHFQLPSSRGKSHMQPKMVNYGSTVARRKLRCNCTSKLENNHMACTSTGTDTKNIADTGSFVSQGNIHHLSSHLHQTCTSAATSNITTTTSSSYTPSPTFPSRYRSRSAQSEGVLCEIASPLPSCPCWASGSGAAHYNRATHPMPFTAHSTTAGSAVPSHETAKPQKRPKVEQPLSAFVQA